jgi:hypothetical protein
MRSGSAVRLGLLIKERRLSRGHTRDSLLSALAELGGDVEVGTDYLVELELRKRHLPIGDPRFHVIARFLNINKDDIVGCVIGAMEDTIPLAP